MYLLAAIVVTSTVTAFAQVLEPTKSDVGLALLAHKSWRTTDGSLPASPIAITQTTDGYIWVATDVGLLRFDGVRFVPFEVPGSAAIRQIVSLLADRDGSLWVGASSGIFHVVDSRVIPLKRRVRANQFAQAADGKIWFAGSRRDKPAVLGGLCWVVGDDYDCTPGEELVYSGQSLALDGNGGIWLSMADRMCHWSPASVVCATDSSGRPSLGEVSVVRAAPSGKVWLGAKKAAKSASLILLDSDFRTKEVAIPGLDTTTVVQAIKSDSSGALWVGTSNRGLYRVSDARIEKLTIGEGLSSNNVVDAMQDRESTMWVVTSEGVEHFYKRPIETWSMRQGLTADSVSSIAVDKEGRVYFGNEGALDVLEHGIVRSVKAGEGLPGQTVQGMLAARDNQLWLAVDGKVFRFDGAAFAPLALPADESTVTVITQDAEGFVWMRAGSDFFRATAENASKLETSSFRTSGDMAADPVSGVWTCSRGNPPAHLVGGKLELVGEAPNKEARSSPIVFVYRDLVWCGTSDGLLAWQNGVPRTLGPENGLKTAAIYAAVLDVQNNLWLMDDHGYIEIWQKDLDAWLADGSHKISPRRFGASDGAHPGSSTFAHSAQLAPNGDLWFATDRFAQRIRPSDLGLNAVPPPVRIESVRIDGRSQVAATSVELAPRTHTFEVDYTALTFINSDSALFRYKLEGVDEDWQDAGSRRQAIYTDLSPGSHVFRVMASNSDGIWSVDAAVMSVTELPAFYQTTWFLLLCVLFCGALVWLAYLARVRKISASIRSQIDARMKEREMIARDLHDTLFQGLQALIHTFRLGIQRLADDEPSRGTFEAALLRADDVLAEGREQVTGLRRHIQLGRSLESSLSIVASELAADSGMVISVNAIGRSIPITPAVFEEAYRIGNEALSNAYLHADATKIDIDVLYESACLTLIVRDNGKGFDPACTQTSAKARHFGLVGMRERSAQIRGSLTIASSEGGGATVTLQIPGDAAYVGGSRSRSLRRLFRLLRSSDEDSQNMTT